MTYFSFHLMAAPWRSLSLAFLFISSLQFVTSQDTETFTLRSGSSLLQFGPTWNNRDTQRFTFEFRTHKASVVLAQHSYVEDQYGYHLMVALDNGKLYLTHMFKDYREKLITETVALNDNRWHHVSVTKAPRAGHLSLTVDLQNYTKTLRAYTDAFAFNFIRSARYKSQVSFGGLPTFNNQRILPEYPNYSNFIGCVREITYYEANEILLTQSTRKRDILDGCVGVCEAQQTCQHGGACIDYYSHSSCDCYKTRYEGEFCETPVTDLSSVTLKGHDRTDMFTFDIKQEKHDRDSLIRRIAVSFKTSVPNTVLLHVADQVTDVQLTIYLHTVGLKAVLTAVSNPHANQTSSIVGSHLLDNRWHHLLLEFNENQIQVRVDNATEVLVFPARGQHILSNPFVTFGGYSPYNAYIGRHGFVGCMRNVYVNHISVLTNLKKYNIDDQKLVRGCESRLVDQSVISFTHRGASAASIVLEGAPTFRMKLQFRTQSANGLLAYHEFLVGPYKRHLQLYLADEFVILSMLQGSVTLRVKRSNAKEPDPQEWHSVAVNVTSSLATLSVDGVSDSSVLPADRLWFLSTTFIGGITSSQTPDKVNGFVGCLRNFTIQGVNVNRTTANATPGVLFGGRDLPDHCKGQGHIQCQNGGLCRSDWFTSYCDCSRTGYEGPTCSLSTMKRSCDEYYQSGDEESGVHLIDPDGRGPRPPVYVYCRMGVTWGQDKTRRGVTVIHHNIRPDTPARSDSLPSHVKKVTYRGMDSESVQTIVNQSLSCRQKIQVTCVRSPLWLGKLTWLRSINGENIMSLGSDVKGHCGCQDARRCVDTRYNCNCDQRSGNVRVDGGYHYRRDHLPISEMVFLQHYGQANVTLGPLECIGHVNEVSSAVHLADPTSFLALPSWSFGSLRLDVRTTSDSGVILYQAPRKATNRNNLTLSLINKHTLRLAFSVAGKQRVINADSHGIFNDGSWQQVALERDADKLRLQINQHSVWISLDDYNYDYKYLFAGHLYFGGSPSHKGIVGCLRKVYYNDQFHGLPDYITESDGGVTPGCVTACDSSPCHHGSQCVSAGRHDYQCICQNPLVQLGKNCEKDINIKAVTLLTQESYLLFHEPLSLDFPKSDMVFSFRTHQMHGVLLYLSFPSLQSYLLLNLQAGRTLDVQFHSGGDIYQHTMTLQGLNNGKWKQVSIVKKNLDWQVSVDNFTQTMRNFPYEKFLKISEENLAVPHTSSLPLYSVYFGGLPSDLLPPYTGITGCVRGLRIGQQIFDPHFSINQSVIEGCRSGCDVSPCQHGGICQDSWQGHYSCDCSRSTFTGRYCDQEIGASFGGQSCVTQQVAMESLNEENLVLTFATRGQHGQKMVIAKLQGKDNDIVISVDDDGMYVSLKLENARSQLTLSGNFTDGERHRLEYLRKEWKTVQIKVDGAHKSLALYDGRSTFSAADRLYVGGSPLVTAAYSLLNFTGCISNVQYKTTSSSSGDDRTFVATPLHALFGYTSKDEDKNAVSVDGERVIPDFCGVYAPLQVAPVINMVTAPPTLPLAAPVEIELMSDDSNPHQGESAAPPPNMGLAVGLPVGIILFLILLAIIIAIIIICRKRRMGKMEFSKPDEEQGLVREVPKVRFESPRNGSVVIGRPGGAHKKTAKILASMEDLDDDTYEDESKLENNDQKPLIFDANPSPPAPKRLLSDRSDIPLIDETVELPPSTPEKMAKDAPAATDRTPDKLDDSRGVWQPDLGQSPLIMNPLTTSTPYPKADVIHRPRPGRGRPGPEYSADSADVLASGTPTNSRLYSEVWTESQVLTMLDDQEEENDDMQTAPLPGGSPRQPTDQGDLEPETKKVEQETPNVLDDSEPSAQAFVTANSGQSSPSGNDVSAQNNNLARSKVTDQEVMRPRDNFAASELDAHEKDMGTEKGQRDVCEKEIQGKVGGSPDSSLNNISPKNNGGTKMVVPVDVHVDSDKVLKSHTNQSSTLGDINSNTENGNKDISKNVKHQENKTETSKENSKSDTDTTNDKTDVQTNSPQTVETRSPSDKSDEEVQSPVFKFDCTDGNLGQRNSNPMAHLPEGTKLLSPPIGVSPGIPDKKGKKKYKKNQSR